MIKIDRGNIAETLRSTDVEIARERLNQFYSAKDRSQKRHDFPLKRAIDSSLKETLFSRFHGKCSYCEMKIESSELGVIDRFRPYNGVRDKDEYFPDLYWWLTYAWDNLVYSCVECHKYKANYFPIKGTRALKQGDDLKLEQRLLIDPANDDPFVHFGQREGQILPKTEAGRQTIELLNLNRTTLVDRRRIALAELNEILTRLNEGIDAMVLSEVQYLNSIFSMDPSIEFLFVKFHMLGLRTTTQRSLSAFIEQRVFRGLPQGFKTKVYTGKEELVKSDYFPIEYVHIKNFKTITDLKIRFPIDVNDDRPWLFILGENGVGKSSVLQALAIGLKNTFKSSNKVVSSLIQTGKHRAVIRVKERDSRNLVTTTLYRRNNKIVQTGFFDSHLIGYGSLRLSPEDGGQKQTNKIDKVSYLNLFDPIKSLNDVTQWLKGVQKSNRSMFDSIAFSIKQLLPNDTVDGNITIEEDKIVFDGSGVPLSSLSDGYRSTITLALDIMMKLSSTHADMDKISGIVIIDELGNQLHPRWQMRIVSQLRTVFKGITFVVSTHHPLCLRGSRSNEIVLLKKVNGRVVMNSDLPDTSGLRVDQLLASEFFGLSSLIDPELEAKFNRYYKLLSLEPTLTEKESAELSELRLELRDEKQLGDSLREELMYHVIDTLLAKKVAFSDINVTRESLKDETIEKVRSIWQSLNG